MKKVKIQGKQNYYRDMNSKSVVIEDPIGLKQAKARKAKINNREKEFENLKTEMSEIKKLLEELLRKENGSN